MIKSLKVIKIGDNLTRAGDCITIREVNPEYGFVAYYSDWDKQTHYTSSENFFSRQVGEVPRIEGKGE